MPVKLFILGLPGSGKSTIGRYINSYARKKHIPGAKERWSTKRFNDYGILYEMAKHPIEGKMFEPAEAGGFNAIDISALDIALRRMERKIDNHIRRTHKQKIIIIEFARNDYQRAFRQFKTSFIQDAYFIHLDVEVEVCQQRIHDRVAQPESKDDDYLVSDRIFETYYHSDDGQYLPRFLSEEYGIDEQSILLIDNNHTLQDATKDIIPFIENVFGSSQESLVLSIPRETL